MGSPPPSSERKNSSYISIKTNIERASLKIKQVARYLQVNESTIYKLAQKGEIPGFKVSGIPRFWKEDIRAWRDKNADCPPEKGRVNKLLI
ncbi:MAG: helix-turn-helix domain-containing protein [bacterium]